MELNEALGLDFLHIPLVALNEANVAERDGRLSMLQVLVYLIWLLRADWPR